MSATLVSAAPGAAPGAASGAGSGTGHQTLLPRSPGGHGAGAALALVAHAGLIAALTVSVDWRAQPPDVVSAELWSSVPQVAAPRVEAPVPAAAAPVPMPEPVRPPPPPAPPPPAPAPAPAPAPPPPAPVRAPVPAPAPAPRVEVKPPAPAPDIVTERERRRAEFDSNKKKPAPTPAPPPPKPAPPPPERVDRAKLDAERRKEAQEAKAEEDRLARLREDNLRRMMGQAGQATGNAGSTGEADSRGTAAQSAAPSAAYAGIVAKVIRDQSVFTSTVPGNPAAEVEVRSGPSGTIVSRRLIKSSGVKAWDDAVLQAIDKVGRLPPDEKGRVPPQMIIAFRPNA